MHDHLFAVLKCTFVAFAVSSALTLPVHAEEPSEEAIAYVEANVVATFYHELGHAMIDVMELPVLGQEEDAADVLSVVLTSELWTEEYAVKIASASATSFLVSATGREDDRSDYADTHGLNLQRFFNTVCLFYGANPEARAAFASKFELPEERAESCPEEYELALNSWGPFLDDITTETPGTSLQFEVDEDDSISVLLAEEILSLNDNYTLPKLIRVELASCGEANAFYSPPDRLISICTEFVDFLRDEAEAEGM